MNSLLAMEQYNNYKMNRLDAKEVVNIRNELECLQ